MPENELESDGSTDVVASLFDTHVSFSHYDFVLAVIPLAFLASLLLGSVAPVSLNVAVAGASVLGAFALCDALFVNPPS